MAVGSLKIFKSIRKFSTPTPYVDNKNILLTSITQELGNLAKILAARADEVGFFKLAQKCKCPWNLQHSH